MRCDQRQQLEDSRDTGLKAKEGMAPEDSRDARLKAKKRLLGYILPRHIQLTPDPSLQDINMEREAPEDSRDTRLKAKKGILYSPTSLGESHPIPFREYQ